MKPGTLKQFLSAVVVVVEVVVVLVVVVGAVVVVVVVVVGDDVDGGGVVVRRGGRCPSATPATAHPTAIARNNRLKRLILLISRRR
jgi:hypothetical protein